MGFQIRLESSLPGLELVALLSVLAFHAVFLPAFEGPDEPFHLARAVSMIHGEAGSRGSSDQVPPEIVAAVRAYPCGPDLERALGCESFGSNPAAFNLLSLSSGPVDSTVPLKSEPYAGEPVVNYQQHQPPLAYLGMAGVLLAFGVENPLSQLLLLRLVAARMVIGGVLLLRAFLTPATQLLFAGGLLLPGAVESLVRVSNDVPVFFWACCCLFLLYRERRWSVVAVGALGPLIKLTAFPVVAFLVVSLWRRGARTHAVAAGLLSGLVIPIQYLRGWAWGGTLELNTAAKGTDSLMEIVQGVLHSGYTFTKTAFWLGGWSVFRPPIWLLGLAAFVVLLGLSRLQPRDSWRRGLETHGPALVFAALGFVAFAIGKRHLFGVWGAVGGWYFWPWTPWLALAFQEICTFRTESKLLVASLAGLIVLSRWAWLEKAIALYGWP